MTISGGIKFFEPSKFLFKNGTRAFDMKGGGANSILNHSRNNGWVSKDSNDTTKEQILIELTGPQLIDRLILNQHNFKDVTIYLISQNRILQENSDFLLQINGGRILNADNAEFEFSRYVIQESADDFFLLLAQDPGSKVRRADFSSFSGIPADANLQRTLTASNITDSTTYFSFDETVVTTILIEVTTTQTVNVQKTLQSIVGTVEIGTLTGSPQISPIHDRKSRNFRAISGKSIIQKGSVSINAVLGFDGFTDQTDQDLIETLFDRDNDFLVWFSGGRSGTVFFRPTIKGFNLDDIYLMQVSEALSISQVNSVFTNPVNESLQLSQVVG